MISLHTLAAQIKSGLLLFVFPLLFPAVLHPTRPFCKLFIMDDKTFKRQIYGQTQRDCMFQVLEPNAPGTKSLEALGEPRGRLCSYETKIWSPEVLLEPVSCGWWICGSPWNFLFFTVPKEIVETEWCHTKSLHVHLRIPLCSLALLGKVLKCLESPLKISELHTFSGLCFN